eukprot:262621-Chlamydomonas_euryale.AAC.5
MHASAHITLCGRRARSALHGSMSCTLIPIVFLTRGWPVSQSVGLSAGRQTGRQAVDQSVGQGAGWRMLVQKAHSSCADGQGKIRFPPSTVQGEEPGFAFFIYAWQCASKLCTPSPCACPMCRRRSSTPATGPRTATRSDCGHKGGVLERLLDLYGPQKCCRAASSQCSSADMRNQALVLGSTNGALPHHKE